MNRMTLCWIIVFRPLKHGKWGSFGTQTEIHQLFVNFTSWAGSVANTFPKNKFSAKFIFSQSQTFIFVLFHLIYFFLSTAMQCAIISFHFIWFGLVLFYFVIVIKSDTAKIIRQQNNDECEMRTYFMESVNFSFDTMMTHQLTQNKWMENQILSSTWQMGLWICASSWVCMRRHIFMGRFHVNTLQLPLTIIIYVSRRRTKFV